MAEAVRRGARTLDCFDGDLTTLYASFGFVESSRMRFVEEFAPPSWKKGDPKPDVVRMAYRGGPRATIASRAYRFPPPVKTSVRIEDWDEATRKAQGDVREGEG